jgi:hypothetical protein
MVVCEKKSDYSMRGYKMILHHDDVVLYRVSSFASSFSMAFFYDTQERKKSAVPTIEWGIYVFVHMHFFGSHSPISHFYGACGA